MTTLHGFELIREENIEELKSIAKLYRHVKTGAELLSIINDDENKAFAITFRTPPQDSTGVAHILEHSVLCGSRKYPLKEPFIELVKGSLKTFLNAFTGSAETYYPVASVNTRDFYNLVDVYLDSVFYPRLTPHIFQQEGWHYELADKDESMIYKGVVFNEMKGAYASPDTVLYDAAERSLFPNHVYGVSSGGEPQNIPNLTYEQLKSFHETYYHPSNSRIWFWGDDDPDERLRLLNEYLQEFEPRQIDSSVPLHPHFKEPLKLTHAYAVGSEEDEPGKGMFSMNWLLTDRIDFEQDLATEILNNILAGTPASPLRRAVIDSGLVEDVRAGVSDIRQRSFRMGMKGVVLEKADAIEELVLDTLTTLATEGIDPDAIAAAVNTVEFSLRELNTGGFPRGLMVMFYSMSSWLYDADPIIPLRFEAPLAAIKAGIASGGYFESMIRRFFLDNPHRTTIVYTPDPTLARREAEDERDRLDTVRAAMSETEIRNVIDETRYLQQLQQTPDSEEALATLPRLTLADLDREVKRIPTESSEELGCRILYHDIFTNGITYLDLGLDLHALSQDLLPIAPLFGRSLLEMGTKTEDFIKLTQRIGRTTGGISQQTFNSSVRGVPEAASYLFLRAKATPAQAKDMMDVLSDILLNVRLDNKERFKQMAIEERVRMEAAISPGGHGFTDRRLRARFTEAGWAGEQMGGISYLFFVRNLVQRIESDWPGVLADLEKVRGTLLNRGAMICNVTLDAANYQTFRPRLQEFLEKIPGGGIERAPWDITYMDTPEGLIIPGQVNYVGKAANLISLGYAPRGTALVVNNFLRTSWLWEKVRVEGGAYGGFCNFDQISGVFAFLSYRDPNLIGTLENYDGSSAFLDKLDLSDAELTRNIIGTISDLDAYQLPDAKGYTAMLRILIGETDEIRQQRRYEVLAANLTDFHAFGEILAEFNKSAQVVVIGSKEAIEAANQIRPNWLQVTKVL